MVVVGGGISAAACVNSLLKSSPALNVRVLDKAKRPGGRLGARTLDLPTGSHEVDIGAAYLTASEPEFVSQVKDWCERDLLRPWVNTLSVFDNNGAGPSVTGPMRYAANQGLRSLATDLFAKVSDDVVYRPEVSVSELAEVIGPNTQAVVLACPVPQAMRILTDSLSQSEREDLARFESSPAITAWGWFAERSWPDFNAAFINDHPMLTLIADDGARRGDGAPVLVAHSTSSYALANPVAEGTSAELLAQAMKVLNVEAALVGSAAHRWGLAQPIRSDDRQFWFSPASQSVEEGVSASASQRDFLVGICGDEWGGPSKVETAWLSGHRLGRFIAETLNS